MSEFDLRYQEYVIKNNLQGKTEQEVLTHMEQSGWLSPEEAQTLRTSGAFSVGKTLTQTHTDEFQSTQNTENTQSQLAPQKIVLTEEQAQEQVISTVVEDVIDARNILMHVDNGVISKGYDKLKTSAFEIKKAGKEEETREDIERMSLAFGGVVGYLVSTYLYDKTMDVADYAYSNVEENVALQAVGADNMQLAKNKQLSKKEYYLQNKEHLKTMLIRRLYMKDQKSGDSFIDRNCGNMSKEEFGKFLEDYINDMVDKLQDLDSIKTMQRGLTALSAEQTEEYYQKLLQNAKNQPPKKVGEINFSIKMPEVPLEFNTTEAISFEEVFKYERGTEFSKENVQYHINAKTDMDYILGAYNKHQTLKNAVDGYKKDYNSQLAFSSMSSADFGGVPQEPNPAQQSEKVTTIFEEYFANPVNPNFAKEKLEEVISKNKLPILVNSNEAGELSLDLSALSSDSAKNRALNNILSLLMQEQNGQLEEIMGGNPEDRMLAYQQSYNLSREFAYGSEYSKSLAEAMDNDNKTVIKRVTGDISSAGMGMTVIGGVLCFTPLAPLGATLLTAGNATAITGMVSESALGYTEALTRNDISEEELIEITKTTLMNAGGFGVGMVAGKLGMKAFGNIIDDKLATVFNQEIAMGNRAGALKAVFCDPNNLANFMQAAGAKVGTDFLISYAGDLAMMGVLGTQDDWQSLLKSNLIGIMVGMSSDIKDVSGANGRFGSAKPKNQTPMAFGAISRRVSDAPTQTKTSGTTTHTDARSSLIEKLNNAKTYEELQALMPEIRNYQGSDKQRLADFWRMKNEKIMLDEDVSDMKFFDNNNTNVKIEDVEQKFISLLNKKTWEMLKITLTEENKNGFNAIANILQANGYNINNASEFYKKISLITVRKDFISENADLLANIINAKDNNGRRRLSQETILDVILSEEMTVETLQALNNAMNIKNGDDYRYSEDELLIFFGEGKNEHLSEDYQTSDKSFVTYGIDTKQKGETNVFDGSKKEVRDSEGKLLYIEEYRQSELEGKFDIIRTDINGKETVVGLASRSVNGELSIVEKTLFGADNTKTDYVFVENTNGRLSYSKITDSDGKVLVENKINFRKIDETHYKSVENGIEYHIEYTSDKIIVTSNGKTAEINIVPKSKLDAEGNTKELGISEELLPVVKQLPGSVLMSVKELGLDGITLSRSCLVEDNAQFNLTDNRIYISPEYANNLFVVLHELGHFIDYKTDIHSNPELLKIYNEERNNLINNGSIVEFSQMSYFTSLMHMNEGGAITEMIAETHAINNASNTDPELSSRGALLQQHFPKTYAKITELLNEAKQSGTPKTETVLEGPATKIKSNNGETNPLRPKQFETTDAYKLTEVVSEVDLARIGSELLTTVNGKKVLTPEADEMVRNIANQIHNLALKEESGIVDTMIKMGFGTEETLRHRSKSVQSTYDKIKNALIDDEKCSLKDAVGTVFDGVGVRTVSTIDNFANHPDVKKYLDAGDFKTAYQKAVELESNFVLESLMKYVDLCAEGKNEVTLTRISNYMGEDGIPYFTEKQLQKLKAYAISKKVNLPIVERVMDFTERTQAQTENSYRKKSTTKVRGSGYTALQMNFVTKDGFSYEWQYRKEKVDAFAEGEHIPYDLRTNKDIIGTHTELTRLYEPIKDLLTNKEKMPDTKFDEYNYYLTAYYEHLRLVELGLADMADAPKLPKGFDERLRAENLELIHEIAEKIKKEPHKEAEYLKEYEERLIRNTDENTTTKSYTQEAEFRKANKTIDQNEAETRLGANREDADLDAISDIIDACRNSNGEISHKLISEAEFLMAQGYKTDEIINKINNIKLSTQKTLISNNLKIDNYGKDFYLLDNNFFKNSSIENMPQLSHLTSEEIANVLRQSISENSITGVIPSPYIDKQYIINARDKQNNIVNIIYEIDKNGKPLFVSKETTVELKDKNIIRKQFADGSKIVEEIFKSENLFSTAQIGYQKTWYDSNGIQVRSEVMAPTKRAGEYTLNSYERNQSNGYIKTELGKVRTYGSREQGLRVEKNLTSPDGTNTKILKISGPKGNAIDYVITDKDGTQLLSVQRRHRQIDENHYESSLNGQKYSIDFSGEKITASKIDENGNIIESITLDNKQLTPELIDLYKSLPGDYFFKIKATGVKVNVSNNVQTYGGACYDPITNEIRLSPDIKDNLFFISHELGHALDFQVLNKLKDDPQFKAIVNTDILNYHNAATLTEGTTIDYFSKYDISTNTTPYAEIIGETLAILSGKSNTQTNICGNRTDVLSANYAKSIAYASKALLNPEAYLSSKISTVASKPEIDPILKTQHLQVIQAMRKDPVGRHQMVENTKTLLANNNNLLASNEFLKTKIDEMLNMYENIEKYTDDQIIEKIAELSQIESSVLDKQIQGFNTSFYGSIKIIAGYIPIGKRILEGFSNAKNALLKNIEKQESDDAFYKNYTELIHNPERTISVAIDLYSDIDFKNIVQDLAQHYYNTRNNIGENISELIKSKDIVRIYQVLIEESGVGPTKLAQIISNMTDLMDKIEKYSPELRSAIENTRSDCTPTRTVQEAQEEIDLAFKSGNGTNSRKYEIIDRMGTASMGETYLAKRPDGKICVIKMLKRGIDETQLNLEKRFYTKLISAFNDDTTSAQKQIAIINQCYNDWADELSFQHEYGANKLLANGAKRYTVADAIDISENGQCLVMDVAQGIQMKSLMKMLKFYKENPEQYAKKYDKKIQENPWLADPERILQELPETLSKTFIEQYLFMKEGGKSLMHGDPHMGNYFIYQNAEGKLMPEFIDTGLCIVRNTDDIKADLKFFSNYIVGNTDAVAEYFVEKCDIQNTEKEQMIKIISKEIKDKIFNQQINVTGFADVQSAILNILDENGLSIRSDEATAMKAQLQFLLGIADAYHLSGRKFDLNPFITDIPKASYSMLREGVNPLKEITTAFNFALNNQVQATSTAGQFIFKSRITDPKKPE